MVRFDKPCLRVSGALQYFSVHMAKQDYLTEKGHVEMTWYGEGAKKLGLSGVVDETHFARLCAGKHPITNEKLTIRDKGANRRVCYFGQISAPKDVSVALLVGGDKRIEGWWKEAVKETLREIEQVTATRVRKLGAQADRTTSNIIAGVVTHDTSRALDPQLHTHVCIMNATYDEVEKRWKGIQPSGYYHYESFFREVSYNKLAEKMIQAGYVLEQSRSIGFNIRGFPPECREMFSKRREEIERVAAAEKTRNQDRLQSITVRTRAGKKHVDADMLKANWREESRMHLPSMEKVIAQAKGIRRMEPISKAKAVTSASEHHFERKSVVDERLLLREALIAGRGRVSLEQLRHEISLKIESGILLRHENQVTSKQARDMEMAYITWAFQGLDQFAALGKGSNLETSLGDDQRAAVSAILASKDRLVILQGDAGTGKTTSLRAIMKGIEAQGSLVFACAPSSGATDVLRHELTAQAETLQQLLVNVELQQRLKGRTLIVDEAGLISTRQMHDLCVVAQQHGCRVLLVGDIKQHASVEAGDALRALQRFAQVPVIGLTQIRRQQDPEYRKAVSLLAQGEPYQAFGQLERLGAVHEEKDFRTLLGKAADTYTAQVTAGKSCVAISPVWSEVHAFTREVRHRLKGTKILHGEEVSCTTISSLQLTRESRNQVETYQPGDVLMFHRAVGLFEKHESVKVISKDGKALSVQRAHGSPVVFDPRSSASFDVGVSREMTLMAGERLLIQSNCKEAKVKNGDIVEVASWDETGAIKLKDGRQLPAYFRQFTYGYASTSHAAQGKTVDHGFLILGDEGMKAANLRQAYVSNSRFRLSQTIFTTDKKAAFIAMATPAERMLAMELPSVKPEKIKPVVAEDPEINLWFQQRPGQRTGIKV
jgi:conjugative relaxase-like TrwC/TraI family protein